MFDAVIVGSGPNGLCAAVALASWGFSVCLIEGAEVLGGGLRCHSDIEQGYIHDHCSAVHPMGYVSSFLRSLDLETHGLRWCSSPVSVAHPLLDGPAAVVSRDFDEVGQRLTPRDARTWKRIFAPYVKAGLPLVDELMAPPSLLPQHPFSLLRFAWQGVRPATTQARGWFEGAAAQALFGGLAGHSILPLERRPSAALGLMFGLVAHLADWPCVEGGSQGLCNALVSKLRSLGGEVRSGTWIRDHADLPPHRIVLYDVTPRALARIERDRLPARYRGALERYRYGPGTFKLDFTLDAPIPWNDPIVARASTVHVAASLDEIAASERAPFEGDVSERPYLIVCQQSALDPSRAPEGKHTGYAYCHVPHGYDGDVSERIEEQIERFAPGFRQVVRRRKVTRPADFEKSNPNLLGGVVAGGVADLGQLFTRPVARLDPYSTPHEGIFLCSASTPPGGGVHGMCGFHAARSAAKRLRRLPQLRASAAPPRLAD